MPDSFSWHFLGAQLFENTRTPPDTLQNSHLSEVQPLILAISVSLLSEELRIKPLYLAIFLSLTIRIEFNFTVLVPFVISIVPNCKRP
jgi:small basic protein